VKGNSHAETKEKIETFEQDVQGFIK